MQTYKSLRLSISGSVIYKRHNSLFDRQDVGDPRISFREQKSK